MKTIKDLDILALTEDLEATPFETKQIIKLHKGQVGTIVMEFNRSALELEFSSQNGTTSAMEAIPATKLMLLHYELLKSVGMVRRRILPRTNNVDKLVPTQLITPIKHRRPTVKFN